MPSPSLIAGWLQAAIRDERETTAVKGLAGNFLSFFFFFRFDYERRGESNQGREEGLAYVFSRQLLKRRV